MVNHAVVAVGYGRTASVLPWRAKEYFIVRNTWGVGGYFRIRRGRRQQVRPRRLRILPGRLSSRARETGLPRGHTFSKLH